MRSALVSPGAARALDDEAAVSWGLSPFALVEAAGRNCAGVLAAALPRLFPREGPFPGILVLAGAGNNGADALVMLRALILAGRASPARSRVLLSRISAEGEESPRAGALRALDKMGVPRELWAGALPEGGAWDLVVDGIAGTGIDGPLRGAAAEMAAALEGSRFRGGRGAKPPVVSIDIPSGLFEGWEPGMPLAEADYTLGIEPLKTCLYNPQTRARAGTILKVGEIFPPALIAAHRGAELLDWEAAAALVPPLRPDDHKYRRGLAEIHAGSPGSAGAARIAARGAQAAGAGIVRLMLDREIYPILAASAGGIMAAPAEDGAGEGRFRADALLLGPGWGRSSARGERLERALEREAEGTPLILDADGIHLARGKKFHGNTVLTPHPGEFAAWTGISPEELFRDPGGILLKTARERNGVILFKGCVLLIAAPDGRLGYVDGMIPALGAGGTGDLLAGFCAALAARMKAGEGKFDGYACACAAAALLIESARREGLESRFIDPLDLAEGAAKTAGSAWL